jgi:hypothetical protein
MKAADLWVLQDTVWLLDDIPVALRITRKNTVTTANPQCLGRDKKCV